MITTDFLSHPLFEGHYDCLILASPDIRIQDQVSECARQNGVSIFNISQALSEALIAVPLAERTRFSQQWLPDAIAAQAERPVICASPDLLFDPSLKLDPFALCRQVARIARLVILWPGTFYDNVLAYAIPEHHHYRTWRISNVLTQQPAIVIRQVDNPQGV